MHAVTKKLLAWYRTHRRDLPWRKTNSAYHIFVSELMLQQTRVDHVIPKYQSFLNTFPSWNALASASTSDLIHAWSGLGYNRRALYAREAAQMVMQNGVPTNEAEWRTLKGVGPYMAAALAEFANRTRAVVMDTNVRRVVGRIALGLPYPSIAEDKRIIHELDRLTPLRGAHWDLPQAIMDFANAVCLASKPHCTTCPLQKECHASKKFLSGTPPKRQSRRPTERIHRDKPFPDRIYRGRILGWIKTHGRATIRTIGPKIDPDFDTIADTEWIHAMCGRLAKDGLIVIGRGDTLSLPNS